MAVTDFASKEDGAFKRQVSSFRDVIEPNGKFPPEKGRYHLYVSYACPWAHRALITRRLKGLEDFIDVSVVHPWLLEGGWHFIPKDLEAENTRPADDPTKDSFPGATIDKVLGKHHLSEIYRTAEPDYSARFTVPVIFDKQTNQIVSNESSEIIRFLTNAFDSQLPDGPKKDLDIYPEELRTEIDELNSWVYDGINNGVYKSGFATKQSAYTEANNNHIAAMDRMEQHLADGREYLVGGRLTEADIRLFTTIIRYDPVYYVHFKCNWGSIRHDYPNIHRWVRNLYWNNDAFKIDTNFDHIKAHYYYSHVGQNPNRIVPLGPHPNVEALDGKRKGENLESDGAKAAKQ